MNLKRAANITLRIFRFSSRKFFLIKPISSPMKKNKENESKSKKPDIDYEKNGVQNKFKSPSIRKPGWRRHVYYQIPRSPVS